MGRSWSLICGESRSARSAANSGRPTWTAASAWRRCRSRAGIGLFVTERGALGDQAQEARGRATRLIHAGLPLADRLLTSAQLVRKLLLGVAQMAAQRLHA